MSATGESHEMHAAACKISYRSEMCRSFFHSSLLQTVKTFKSLAQSSMQAESLTKASRDVNDWSYEYL